VPLGEEEVGPVEVGGVPLVVVSEGGGVVLV
jgi:hypothetical protein